MSAQTYGELDILAILFFALVLAGCVATAAWVKLWRMRRDNETDRLMRRGMRELTRGNQGRGM